MFITFEGGEGSGKSTQIKLLSEALARKNIAHIVTREPGGTPGAETIRKLLVEGAADQWDAEAETLLFLAARVDHVHRVIKPALAAGKWVLCDRFIDSTIVYQGVGKGLPLEWIAELHRYVLGDFQPDKTFILDIAPEEGLKRASARGKHEGRFEAMELEFHRKVREGFLAIARKEPERCVVVDADRPAEIVHQTIFSATTLS